MVHLGDPTRDVEVLPDPVPIALEIMPEEVSVNGIVRFFLKRMNKKWEGDKIFFDLDRDLLKVNSLPFWTSEHIGDVLDTLVTQQAL
jgi:hypothetical protein